MEKETAATVCPYDANHIIHKSRLQRHLIKCSRNFPPKYKEACPFNATHLMFASDLEKHIQDCPDRKYVEPERYRFMLRNHGSIASCQASEVELNINDSESWDLASLRDDFSSVGSNSVFELPATKTSVQAEKMRKPLTQSQVTMMNIPNEDARAEDMESVTSSIGRGKLIRPRLSMSKIGRGGRGIIFQDSLRVGASALTDTDDAESVISSIGREIIHHKMMNDSRYASDTDDMISVVSSVGVKRTL